MILNSNKPDFKKCFIRANEILVSSNSIDVFPLSATALIKEYPNLKYCSYKTIRERDGDPIAIGSEDAVLIAMGDKYIILYNDEHIETRRRFSIIHEFGHYILGHNLDLTPGGELYATQEIETNFFTAQLLMPEQLINEFIRRGNTITEDFLMNTFNVSREASKKRIATLRIYKSEWKSEKEKEFDDIILSKYKMILDEISPMRATERSDYIEDDIQLEMERQEWF